MLIYLGDGEVGMWNMKKKIMELIISSLKKIDNKPTLIKNLKENWQKLIEIIKNWATDEVI